MVASAETGSVERNHLGHQTVYFVNYLVKIRKNIKNTRMSVEKFDELCQLVESHISKTDNCHESCYSCKTEA